MKSCFTCPFFTNDTIKVPNEVNTSYFQSELSFFAISKFRFKNDNSFYALLTLLLGDISLSLGPFSNPQLFKQGDWQTSSNGGLHLLHLKINSLLLKFDKLIDIAKRKFTLKIAKLFVLIEISTEEVLLVVRIIGTIYRPPNQSKFLDIFEENLPKLNTSYC